MACRSRSGFEWPVVAAIVVLFVGRLSYGLIVDYQTGGVPAVVAGCVLILVFGVFFAWRNRRRIRHWAAKEPPPR